MSDFEDDGRRHSRHRRPRSPGYSPTSDDYHRRKTRRHDDERRDTGHWRSNHDRDRARRRDRGRDNDDDDDEDDHRARRRQKSTDRRSPPARRPRRSRSPPYTSDPGNDHSSSRHRRRQRSHDRDRPSPKTGRSHELSRHSADPPRRGRPSVPPAHAEVVIAPSEEPEKEVEKGKEKEKEKQAPNFRPSGLLAAETNTVANTDIVLKYNEPPEARKPPARDAWRLYVFKPSASDRGVEKKDAQLLDTVELGERSCWLVGRERAVVDFLVEHPSCSKQHAVLQFRYVVKTDEWGEKDGRVRPYMIDLESANGTMVNGNTIPQTRYVEVRDGDLIQFGHSTREYVLMLPPPGG